MNMKQNAALEMFEYLKEHLIPLAKDKGDKVYESDTTVQIARPENKSVWDCEKEVKQLLSKIGAYSASVKNTCQVCGRKITDGAILHTHHMFYWKGKHGYQLDELVAVCEKCHTPANHQKNGKLYGFGENVKFADLSGAAFMNTVRWQIVNELYAAFGKPFVTITYGAMTKEKRIALQLEKSHNNDAYAMGEFHPNCRCAFEHYEKVRRNNRILEKFYDSRYIDIRTGEIATGKELFNGRINRNHKKDSENLHKYRGKRIRKGYRALTRKKVNLNPGDLVSLNGEVLIVHGTHTKKNGAVNVEFKTPAKSGQKSTSLKKLKIVKAADSIHPAWEKVS